MESTLTYKLIAKAYDLLDIVYFRNKNSNPRTAVNNLIDDKCLNILDICTGTASNAICISKRYQDITITGIDLSKDMLKIAHQKLEKKNIKNIKLLEMDATNLKFHDQTFDAVLISLVLHEISKELAAKMLSEAKRVLKPNGKVIVVEWEKPQMPLKKLLFFPIRKMEPKGFEDFLKLDMKKYFKQFGLTVQDINHCDFSKVIRLKKSDV